MSKYVVCALYKFVELKNYKSMKEPLLKVMQNNMVRGTLLLAEEGINGTISGSSTSIASIIQFLKKDTRLSNIIYKKTYSKQIPFNYTKVKLKKEIVTLGVDGINPLKNCGTYVDPQNWNKLISDPEVLLIDTRNEYEIEIGSFKNAINPHTNTFREFPKYVSKNLNELKHKKVAMFCTGGIRCEKSTAFLKEKGFDKVYHLKGGILKYLEEVAETESLWQGECFVFDSRITVNHSLEQGNYDQCYACRRAITKEDKLRPEYKHGVSCHHCKTNLTSKQKKRFFEREKQNKLARERGEYHLGDKAKKISLMRKLRKQEEREKNRQLNIMN